MTSSLSKDAENHSEAHSKELWESSGDGVCEIEEVVSSEDFSDNNDISLCIGNNKNKPPSLHLQSIKNEGSVHSSSDNDDSVYVVINGKEETPSMDALIWAIDNILIRDSTVLFLVHVFPETKYIPTPLGKLSISQVNPEQREIFMAKERGKRREYLQKFINVCFTSQVKVDTILIESDMEAKAILDLIPILNIKKLVIGATKPVVKKLKHRRGSGVVDQIVQNAAEFCEVKIICEGKEMAEMLMMSVDSPTPHGSSSPLHSNHRSPPIKHEGNNNDDIPSCGCFKL